MYAQEDSAGRHGADEPASKTTLNVAWQETQEARATESRVLTELGIVAVSRRGTATIELILAVVVLSGRWSWLSDGKQGASRTARATQQRGASVPPRRTRRAGESCRRVLCRRASFACACARDTFGVDGRSSGSRAAGRRDEGRRERGRAGAGAAEEEHASVWVRHGQDGRYHVAVDRSAMYATAKMKAKLEKQV